MERKTKKWLSAMLIVMFVMCVAIGLYTAKTEPAYAAAEGDSIESLVRYTSSDDGEVEVASSRTIVKQANNLVLYYNKKDMGENYTAPFTTLADFFTQLDKAIAGDKLPEFYAKLRASKLSPMTFTYTNATSYGNGVALFYYIDDKNEVDAVTFTRDFNIATVTDEFNDMPCKLVEGTRLFVYAGNGPLDSRVSYWMNLTKKADEFGVVTRTKTQDPDSTYYDYEGGGLCSELRMPNYNGLFYFEQFTRYYVQSDIDQKSGPDPYATGELSDVYAIHSAYLPVGRNVNQYWIYYPTTVAAGKAYPVMYILDGQEFISAGCGFLRIIDYLTENGYIDTAVYVFVSASNINRYPDLTQMYYSQFMNYEVLPAAEARIIEKLAVPANECGKIRRGIFGASLGSSGASVTLLGAQNFEFAWLQSTYMPYLVSGYINGFGYDLSGVKLYVGYGSLGDTMTSMGNNPAQIAAYEEAGATVTTLTHADGHAWGQYRRHFYDAMKIFLPVEQQPQTETVQTVAPAAKNNNGLALGLGIPALVLAAAGAAIGCVLLIKRKNSEVKR